jgi:leader peptidase (prepilin peptidase)/N-methyltransferase
MAPAEPADACTSLARVQVALAAALAAAAGLPLGWLLQAFARRLVRGMPATAAWPRQDGGARLPTRLPLVELTTAALLAATVVVHHDDVPRLVLGILLVAFLVPLTLVDLAVRLLPNRLTAPAAAMAVVVGTLLDAGGEPERLIAGGAAGGCFLLAALASPAGMGMGDVKLAAVLGLFLGREVAVAVFVALVAGVAVGVLIMVRKGAREGRKTAVAFGPFLALGGVVAVIAGDGLMDAYLARV